MTWDKFAYIKELRGRTDMTPSEFRLLVTVWSYTDGEGRHARPGASRLARDLGHNGRRQVIRMLQSLVTKGYLMVELVGGAPKEGARMASEYALSIPATGGAVVTSQTDQIATGGAVVTSTADRETTITGGAVVTPSSPSDHDQGGGVSGEADAPPTPRLGVSWDEYTSGCFKRHLSPSRMAWIRGNANIPPGTSTEEILIHFWTVAEHLSNAPAVTGPDWMNR